MSEHEALSSQIASLRNEIADLKTIVEPIANTYATASTIGRWVMGFLVFASVGIGAVLGLRDLLKK